MTGHRHGRCLLAALVLAAAVACSSEEPGEGGARQSSGSGRAERSTGPKEYEGPGKGPYKVRTQTFTADDVGGRLGGGTIHYPAGDSGEHGVIAASPGLGADESMVEPYGGLLASHGFVLITFDTRTREDSPAQRGRQLLHALDHVVEHGPAAAHADPRRLGVLGHSMGGGGALYAASRNPDIKAAVPLTPYSRTGDWPRVSAPTFIIGGSTDEIAAPSTHAEVFYKGLSGAGEKRYLELKGDHFVATPPDRMVSGQVVAWFKRFLDGDEDYDDDICPPPRDERIAESRDTCPLD